MTQHYSCLLNTYISFSSTCIDHDHNHDLNLPHRYASSTGWLCPQEGYVQRRYYCRSLFVVYLDIVTVFLIQDDIIIFNTATVSEIIHDAKQFGFDVQGTV